MHLAGSRRSPYYEVTEEQRVQKALARLHLLEAIVVGIERRDELFRIVNESGDAYAARAAVEEAFGLDEVQATCLLDMQMRRFAELERARVMAERDEVLTRIPEDQRPS